MDRGHYDLLYKQGDVPPTPVSEQIKEEPGALLDQEVRSLYTLPEPIFPNEDLLYHNVTPFSNLTLHPNAMHASSYKSSPYSQQDGRYDLMYQTNSPLTSVDHEASTSLPYLNQTFSPLNRTVHHSTYYPSNYVLRTTSDTTGLDGPIESPLKKEPVVKNEFSEIPERPNSIQELNWSPKQIQQAEYDQKRPTIPTAPSISSSESSLSSSE